MEPLTNQLIKEYGIRNRNVRLLGYRDYAEYLQSQRWKRAKKWCLSFYGPLCLICKKPYTSIHHLNYKPSTLKAASRRRVYRNCIPICNNCHEHIHTYSTLNGQSIAATTRRLYKSLNGSPLVIRTYKANDLHLTSWQCSCFYANMQMLGSKLGST